MYRMVPLCVLGIEIYLFAEKFFQIGQLMNLQPIDSKTDRWAPFLSAEVAGTGEYWLTRIGSHMSGHLKSLKIKLLKTSSPSCHLPPAPPNAPPDTDHRRLPIASPHPAGRGRRPGPQPSAGLARARQPAAALARVRLHPPSTLVVDPPLLCSGDARLRP
jgi:hypothetical protein